VASASDYTVEIPISKQQFENFIKQQEVLGMNKNENYG